MTNLLLELREQLVTRGIPAHMHDDVCSYVLKRHPVGDFLTALFSNDLAGTWVRADAKNRAALQAWVWLLYWDLPNSCWGSKEKVTAWLNADAMHRTEESGEGTFKEREEG